MVGGLYKGVHGTYFALYSSSHEDLYLMPPENIKSEYMMHFRYGKGKKRGGGDIFLVRDALSKKEIKKLNLSKIANINSRGTIGIDAKEKEHFSCNIDCLDKVDTAHSVVWEIQKPDNFPKGMLKEVLGFARADIFDYGDGKFPTEFLPTRTIYTDKIIPVTEIKRIPPPGGKYLDGGKQWFYPQCSATEVNFDLGKGCSSAWIPTENSFSDGKNFTGFFDAPGKKCEYCYAKGDQKIYIKNIYKFDADRFEKELRGTCRVKFGSDEQLGKPVKILRMGKRTEPCTPETNEDFLSALERMAKVGTKGVITQKSMQYDKEKARLFRKTKSVLFYSTGWDFLEEGCVARSATNEWRVEQMLKFREDKVNAIPYLLIVGHKPPGERERKIIELGIPVQLLPIRFNSKDLVRKLTDETWNYLKSHQLDLFLEPNSAGSYTKEYGKLILQRIHPDWLKLIEDNNGRIRICHHDSERFYCGKCFQARGYIDQIIKPDIKKKKSWKKLKKKISKSL